MTTRNKQHNPFPLILIGLLISLFLLISASYLQLATPRLDVSLQLSSDSRSVLLIRAGDNDYSSHKSLPVLTGISAVDEPAIDITPLVLLEEPDILPYSEFNRFMQVQDAIRSILDEPDVILHLQDDTKISIHPRKAIVTDIPTLFWLQNFYCLSALMVGIGIWAFRRNYTEVFLLFLISAGYAAGGVPAAVYSTRELALDGQTFIFLSALSHLGVFIFLLYLIALLWIYPGKINGSAKIPYIASILIVSAWLLNILQIVDFYLMFILFFICIVILTIKQWTESRNKPVQRGAIQWFLLSISMSTATFFVIVILPAAFGHPPLFGSQGSMLIMIWLMFIGITLGVIRYKLFNLGIWWFYAWLWFIGGASIILIDLLLFTVWSIPQNMAFPLSLAIGGWIYFPLRQYLWTKLMPNSDRKMAYYLPLVLENFLSSQTDKDILDYWPQLLKNIFSPLIHTTSSPPLDHVQIDKNGLALLVPGLGNQPAITLEYAEQGRRLFSEIDKNLAQTLFLLMKQSWLSVQAKKQGATLERERIKRELHDGLGAKIQAIMHSDPLHSDSRSMAHDAWRELRTIVSSIDDSERNLQEVLGEWRSEIKRITQAVQINLVWSSEFENEQQVISPLQSLNLKRCITEGVQNAIRHSRTQTITIKLNQQHDCLQISIINDGVSSAPETWIRGSGMFNTIHRVETLGGQVQWKVATLNAVEIEIQIPLAEKLTCDRA